MGEIMRLLYTAIKIFFYKIRLTNSSTKGTASSCKTEGLVEQGRFVKFMDNRYTRVKAEFTKCNSVSRLQETYLQGRLAKQELTDLNLHLMECAACSTKIASIEELLNILFYLQQPVAPDPQLRTSLLHKIKQ